MSNTNFAILHSRTLQSSIWLESAATRVVWFALLMLKDKNGIISGGSVAGLAHTANVTPQECQEALEIFMSPDPQSSTSAHEGRRLEKIEGGWRLLNHEKYQYSSEQKRLWWAAQKQEQRSRKFLKPGKPLKGEAEAIRKLEMGEITREQFDAIAASPGPSSGLSPHSP